MGKKAKKETVAFTVLLPTELHRQFSVQAALEGRRLAEIVRELIKEYLRRQDR